MASMMCTQTHYMSQPLQVLDVVSNPALDFALTTATPLDCVNVVSNGDVICSVVDVQPGESVLLPTRHLTVPHTLQVHVHPAGTAAARVEMVSIPRPRGVNAAFGDMAVVTRRQALDNLSDEPCPLYFSGTCLRLDVIQPGLQTCELHLDGHATLRATARATGHCTFHFAGGLNLGAFDNLMLARTNGIIENGGPAVVEAMAFNQFVGTQYKYHHPCLVMHMNLVPCEPN